MSTGTILLIVIPVLVVLAGILLAGAARRRDTDAAVGTLSRETRRKDTGAVLDAEGELTGQEVERQAVLARSGKLVAAEPAPVEVYTPPDPEVVGVTRRQFLNRAILGFTTLGLASFGAAVLAFIWPSASGGFGSKIRVGPVDDVKARIGEANGFLYVPEGRMWVTEYPAEALDAARGVYSPSELGGMEAGLVALFQTCPHLGCRVPQCDTSQWFECPCHGSRYNRVGERKGGPAPRGMDRFAMSVEGGAFVVDTGVRIQGPAIGIDTTGQEPEGPSCLGSGTHSE
jgi:cytochrome b6-f complex iron-sulfur subunit